jgi:RNA polymerase sigma-70 factor (ECF subfamily)
MLDGTVESANSALKRARASLEQHRLSTVAPKSSPAPASPAEDAIVTKFVGAYESADLHALVALLTDDVFMSMPPLALEFEGREVVAQFCASLFGSGRRFDVVRTRANGQPAFGVYLRDATGSRPGTGVIVLTLSSDRICAINRFESRLLGWFGLPQSLP